MSPKNIRIKDIARLAGVSKGTVDRVLHKRGRVSEESLQKVLKVMQEIEYTPNLIARTLGSNKKRRIIALIPDPGSDPYWHQTNLGIQHAQAEWAHFGIHITIYIFDQYNKESFKKKANEAFLAVPDGILTAPIFYDEALPFFRLLKSNNIPYVLFNTNIPEVQPLSFIGQNLFHSGKVGAELMYLGQHTGGKLILLHLDEDIHNSVHLLEKEKGFREFFQKKNTRHFQIVDYSLNPTEPSFEASLIQLLNDGDLKGIFVSTSKGTSVVASILEKNGKGNIMLIGYDLLEQNLRYLRSGTIDFLINQNPKRQASLGITHLVNYLMFQKKAPGLDLFPLEVITQQNVDSYLTSGMH